MIAAIFLGCAIVVEVTATLALQAAVRGSRWWYVVVGVGYAAAFVFMSNSLAQGMPLGVGYGIWTASGVALTAILGRIIFRQPFTWVMGLGVALIIGGVLCIDLGTLH